VLHRAPLLLLPQDAQRTPGSGLFSRQSAVRQHSQVRRAAPGCCDALHAHIRVNQLAHGVALIDPPL
jgi:hypothetical protein